MKLQNSVMGGQILAYGSNNYVRKIWGSPGLISMGHTEGVPGVFFVCVYERERDSDRDREYVLQS